MNSLREKLDEYVERHGVKDASLERSINQLSELVDRLRASLRQAGIKMEEFERFVARQADRWKLAKATGVLAALLKESGGGDVTDRFLKDEAIDTIRDALNLSFAQIEQICRRTKSGKSSRQNQHQHATSPTCTSRSLTRPREAGGDAKVDPGFTCALALVVLAYRINHSDMVPLTPPRVLPNLNGVSFR